MKLLLLLSLFAIAAVGQQNAYMLPWTPQQFANTNGTLLVSGKVCTYLAGTSTGTATFTDATAAVQNAIPPNAILLDSTARPTSGGIWLTPNKAYKIVTMTAGSDGTCNTGVVIKTQDNVVVTGAGGTNNFKNINTIRFADQFTGGDCGAKINAADADLGATAGEIWVNQNCGLSWTTAVVLSATHILKFIQGGTYSSTAAPMITVNTGGGVVGSSKDAVFLQQTSNGDTISIASGAIYTTVEKLTINPSGTPTAGVCWHPQTNITGAYLRDVRLKGCFVGIQQETGSAVVVIDDVDIYNTVPTTGIGIQILGGLDVYVNRLTMDSTQNVTQPLAGIRLRSVDGLWLVNSDIIRMGSGLLIDPPAGNVVSDIFLSHAWVDSSTGDGILINPSATGTVKRIECECSVAGSGGNGVNIQGGGASGPIDGLHFSHGFYRNNVGHGILVNTTFAVNTEISDALISGNSLGSAGTNHGITIGPGVTQFAILNNRIGPTGGDGNTQGFGIAIVTGASDNYRITGNDLRGNFSGSLSNLGTGLNQYIVANLPVAASSFPAGIALPGSTSGSVTLTAPVVAGVVTGAPAVLQTGDNVYGTYRVTTDQTITAGASLVNIPGLSWTFPANTALNVKFICDLLYSQATAAAADSLGVQDVTVAPTNFESYARADVSATSFSAAPTDAAGVTTPVTVVTMTPSAAGTVFGAHIDGMIEQPSNASTSVFNIMAQFTTNNGTIKRGSSCQVF